MLIYTLTWGLFITFYSTGTGHVMPFMRLGYNTKISEEKIHNAAVVLTNGDSKAWLATAIAKYQPFWTKHVNYDFMFVRACRFLSFMFIIY